MKNTFKTLTIPLAMWSLVPAITSCNKVEPIMNCDRALIDYRKHMFMKLPN